MAIEDVPLSLLVPTEHNWFNSCEALGTNSSNVQLLLSYSMLIVKNKYEWARRGGNRNYVDERGYLSD